MANRVEQVAGDMLRRIHESIVENDVTYEEYQAAKDWLIAVGESGEWPLFLDVFVESVVEQQVYRDRDGSQGTILGPFHLPDHPVLEAPYELPMRPDEKGQRLKWGGRVVDASGEPIANATVDVWQADDAGFYSGFSDLPAGILRGKVITDDEGRYSVRGIVPSPYTIPHDGPTGKLIAAADWHPWRPAHIHAIVSADGYEDLTTQLYIDSSDYLDDDVASAVKDNLIVSPKPSDEDGYVEFEYEFALAPARTPAHA
jgi:catechol 1,2-dioxygenase